MSVYLSVYCVDFLHFSVGLKIVICWQSGWWSGVSNVCFEKVVKNICIFKIKVYFCVYVHKGVETTNVELTRKKLDEKGPFCFISVGCNVRFFRLQRNRPAGRGRWTWDHYASRNAVGKLDLIIGINVVKSHSKQIAKACFVHFYRITIGQI